MKEDFDIPAKTGYASLHSELGESSIAGMCEEADILARMCVDHLDQLIRHRHLGKPSHPRTILLQNVWKDGDSLPSRS